MVNVVDINAYKYFMHISEFPNFETEFFEVDLDQKYVRVAQAVYDKHSESHFLRLPLGSEIQTFLLFHELTHIYDMERYKTGESNYDFCLTGYMEYHAAQVELMVLMGASTFCDKIAFLMNDPMRDFDCSVRQYLEQKLDTAIALLSDDGNQNLLDGIGVFYNFLGMKSICGMYAIDFKDDFCYQQFANQFSPYLLSIVLQFMMGFEIDIDKAVGLYSNVVDIVFHGNESV